MMGGMALWSGDQAPPLAPFLPCLSSEDNKGTNSRFSTCGRCGLEKNLNFLFPFFFLKLILLECG